MFYHFHLIKATVIFHPDYCNTLLTSPSFYCPLLQCIFNIATRDIFNLIQIIHSSVQAPPVTLCITRRKRPSPYNGLLIIALSATLFTPRPAPLCFRPCVLPCSLFSNILTSSLFLEHARSFAFTISSFWNSFHPRYPHGSLPHLLQVLVQISLLSEAFSNHSF